MVLFEKKIVLPLLDTSMCAISIPILEDIKKNPRIEKVSPMCLTEYSSNFRTALAYTPLNCTNIYPLRRHSKQAITLKVITNYNIYLTC